MGLPRLLLSVLRQVDLESFLLAARSGVSQLGHEHFDLSRDRAEGNIRFYIVMILFGGCCIIMLDVLTASDASVARPFVEGDVPTGAESDGAVSQEEGM